MPDIIIDSGTSTVFPFRSGKWYRIQYFAIPSDRTSAVTKELFFLGLDARNPIPGPPTLFLMFIDYNPVPTPLEIQPADIISASATLALKNPNDISYTDTSEHHIDFAD